MKHDHSHCSHDLKFCEKCNVVYCRKCSQEWGGTQYIYTPYYTNPNPWTVTPYYPPLTPYCGSGSALTSSDMTITTTACQHN